MEENERCTKGRKEGNEMRREEERRRQQGSKEL